MGYRLQIGEPVGDGVRRIAVELIEGAIADLQRDDRHEGVHEYRKRCKKMRALVRLVRPSLGETYRAENVWFRDAARRLSDLRDATSRIETCDALASRYEGEIDAGVLAAARRALVERRDAVTDGADLDERIDRCLDAMKAALRRVGTWRLEGDDGFDTLAGGMGKTYRRARRAMETAFLETTTEAFHEWRKRVKYHRYHVRLLRDAWRPVLDPWRDRVHELTDRLGHDHDLALFYDLLQTADDLGDAASRAALSGLIVRRRAELQAQARALGGRLFAEKPGALVARHRAYWRSARSQSMLDAVLHEPGHGAPS